MKKMIKRIIFIIFNIYWFFMGVIFSIGIYTDWNYMVNRSIFALCILLSYVLINILYPLINIYMICINIYKGVTNENKPS